MCGWWSGDCTLHNDVYMCVAICGQWSAHCTMHKYSMYAVQSVEQLVEWTVWSNYRFTSQVHCVQCTVCGVDSELCTSTLCRVHSVEQYVVVRVDSVEQRAV